MVVSKVLYFPTIRVPRSAWLSRVLLYWDQVGTITPYEFVEEPDKHDPHTLRLIRANLVTQVTPGHYVGRIPRFTDSFMEYLETLGPALKERRASFRNTAGFRIHLEKLDQTVHELKRIKLARTSGGRWLEVEQATAQEFMGYLAAVLGRVDELASIPLTDDSAYLSPFITASSPTGPGLEALRTDVLSAILPAPAEALDADEIRRFKDSHGDELQRFRNRVEQKLVELAALQDKTLRARATDLFVEEARQDIDDLQRAMAERGWIRTTLTKVSSIVSSIPGVQPFVGLGASVIAAFGGDGNGNPTSPFLYAAEVEQLTQD